MSREELKKYGSLTSAELFDVDDKTHSFFVIEGPADSDASSRGLSKDLVPYNFPTLVRPPYQEVLTLILQPSGRHPSGKGPILQSITTRGKGVLEG